MNDQQLLHLVAMKMIWPRGPGPELFRTELHLNAEIEKQLLKSIEDAEAHESRKNNGGEN